MFWKSEEMEMTQKLRRKNVKIFLSAKPIETTCQVCGFLARDKDDIESIAEEKACTECVLNFKKPMGDAWLKGERPTESVARERMNIFIDEV